MRAAIAAIAAIEAIRDVNSSARLVHPEPVIHVHAHPGRAADRGAAGRYTLARHEAWDMLAGRLRPELGGQAGYLDILGVTFYPHNQWIFGEAPYNPETAIRRDHPLYRPFRRLLREVHERYGRPLFVAETGADGEDRPAWLRYIGQEVRAAQRAGVPVGACASILSSTFLGGTTAATSTTACGALPTKRANGSCTGRSRGSSGASSACSSAPRVTAQSALYRGKDAQRASSSVASVMYPYDEPEAAVGRRGTGERALFLHVRPDAEGRLERFLAHSVAVTLREAQALLDPDNLPASSLASEPVPSGPAQWSTDVLRPLERIRSKTDNFSYQMLCAGE